MNDRLSVSVTGISCFGYHGVFPQEREHGQRFVVDVDMVLADDRSVESDRLDDTVDYSEVAQRVVSIVEGPPVELLEHLAGRIADAVMSDDRLTRVVIRVSKPDVSLPVLVDSTSVTLRRDR